MKTALQYKLQTLQLIASANSHQFVRNGSFDPAKRIPKIGSENEQSTDKVGFVRHLVNASKNFPHGMIAEKIVFAAHMQSFAEPGVQGAPLAAMMHEALFDKCSGFPTLCSRAQDGD